MQSKQSGVRTFVSCDENVESEVKVKGEQGGVVVVFYYCMLKNFALRSSLIKKI